MNIKSALLFCLALWSFNISGLCSGMLRPPPPVENAARSKLTVAKPQTEREAIIATAAAEIGVTEATGKNDGKQVEAYLASVGLKRGNPYCAAWVYWVGQKSLGERNPFPRSGWSPDFVTPPSWTQGHGHLPRAGDTGGIYFPDKGRIAHTFLIAGTERDQGKWMAPRGYLRTIEANTSNSAASGSAADRDGEGVHSKLRPLSTIRQTKSFLR